MRDVERFFDLLFGDAPDDAFVVLWTKETKRSVFYRTTQLNMAADWTAALGIARDVYVGCGLHGQNQGPGARGTAGDIIAIPALWADIDVQKPGSNKAYFKTREAVVQFLDALPLRPTLRIWTGGGFHAWWLFKEIWCFADDAGRAQAAHLLERWQRLLIARAAASGAAIDSTFDLPRVLRVPGTTNHKYGVPVELVVADGPRAEPSDFDEFLVPYSIVRPTSRIYVEGSRRSDEPLLLRADAEPPPDKLHASLENDLKFRLTWQRQRPDFKDRSPSTYDQSLASLAVRADWTDQEIANLLIAHRRQHGCALKLRVDYYQRTIGKARASVTKRTLLGPIVTRADEFRTQTTATSAATMLRSLCSARARR